LEADCGEAALAALNRSDHDLNLILTDIEMPQVGGLELAGRVKELRADLKVLFMSGSLSHIPQEAHDMCEELVPKILIKPFLLEHLMQMIHEVLRR